MAGLGRSFKPASYLSSMKRRPPPARTMSNSSEASPLSSPDIGPDDAVLSTRPSPNPPADSLQHQPFGSLPSLKSSNATLINVPTDSGNKDLPFFDPSKSTPARARPIAIELPATKKGSSAPVYTPPPPLSARGDLPGGYFPLHEDQTRVYRPHPFQLDASEARMKSIQRASQSSSLPKESAIPAQAATGTTPSAANPIAVAGQSTQTRSSKLTGSMERTLDTVSSTPVTSYIPTGTQENSLPMGKYYPTNYIKRKEEKRSRKQGRPPTSNFAAPTGSKSESQILTARDASTIPLGPSRNESEAKRRLQQYQRDMIAQASLALNGGNVSAATLSSLRAIGFTSVSGPGKPRLAPLGSPGPVTPMELEGPGDGYLGARRLPDAAQIEEISRAIRAREEQKRREGATSPPVELGPSSF
ncbi:hypothetical protein GGS23DRAFT_190722 [Durotheca rogersii]|uniref:uncharacterized protein n=1 Tax=Durotheca rogersii TaxID=419775 RepID=UPI00221FF056|nr:uncharacterized protein GGS23DRAFT_190722 [Durotheca rogersii]KAI5867711.1 hypothetical protein GGS23DRAFT_190722 [Durotheca rogersii]